MAQNSDLKTNICLVWETERPFFGRPRRSSTFRLLEHEFYLEIEICKHEKYKCLISAWLKQTAVNKPLKLAFDVTTYVLVKGTNKFINTEFSTTVVHTVRTTPYRIHSELVLLQCLTQLNDAEDWRVICLLSCAKPLSLQIRNETIHLSTAADARLPTYADECVQASLEIPPDMERLSEDFSSLLEKSILSDAKLTCGGQTRSVHRSVLAARSEVFSAMFRNKMKESETGSVDIPDLEAPVLDLLLKYVYSGKIPDLCDGTAASLYEAGDKYTMHSLKMACSDWMVRNQTEENCVSFLALADAHSDVAFKEAVISFIVAHPAVFQSTAFQKFSKERAQLAVEVCQNFILAVTK